VGDFFVSIEKEFLDKWPSALVTRTEWIEQWSGMREVQSGGGGIRDPPA